MSYTARKLITQAYFISGVVSRDFQTIRGDQIIDALDWLNQLLAYKASDIAFIPYYSEVDITAVPGQETYFIPNLVEVESFTFNIGNVRYACDEASRKSYRGTARIDGVYSLPFRWNFERTVGGGNLSVFFPPADAWIFKIWGKLGFDSVTLGQDMSLIFDGYYINYLEYELAAIICNKYNVPLPAQTSSWLEELRKKTRNEAPLDLQVKIYSKFGGASNLTWGDINIGRGWRPPQ